MRIRSASSEALAADPVLVAGVSLALAAAVAEWTSQLVDYWAFDLRYGALDGNSSAYAFGWLSALLMLTTTAAFLVLARGGVHRRACYALAAAFAFFLVDNIANIHQRTPNGKLYMLPLFATAFALVWRVSSDSDPGVRRALRLGLGALGVSLAVHVAGPTVLARAGWPGHSWEYQAKIAIKECTEIAGWALICAGAVSRARTVRKVAVRDDVRATTSASPVPGS